MSHVSTLYVSALKKRAKLKVKLVQIRRPSSSIHCYCHVGDVLSSHWLRDQIASLQNEAMWHENFLRIFLISYFFFLVYSGHIGNCSEEGKSCL